MNHPKRQGLAVAVLLSVLVVVPSCRTKKKVVVTPPVTGTVATTTETQPPDIATRIEPPADFVKDSPEPSVSSEDLPTNVEELSRMAQSKGWIQDAIFLYDASTLSTDAQEALSLSSMWLKSHNDYALLIEGHCDERGTEQYNLALGDRRANTAKDYMVTLGVDAARIRTVSYGEERPFDAGHDEGAWAANRRAHLVLVRR